LWDKNYGRGGPRDSNRPKANLLRKKMTQPERRKSSQQVRETRGGRAATRERLSQTERKGGDV